jgi:hypothetical protein
VVTPADADWSSEEYYLVSSFYNGTMSQLQSLKVHSGQMSQNLGQLLDGTSQGFGDVLTELESIDDALRHQWTDTPLLRNLDQSVYGIRSHMTSILTPNTTSIKNDATNILAQLERTGSDSTVADDIRQVRNTLGVMSDSPMLAVITAKNSILNIEAMMQSLTQDSPGGAASSTPAPGTYAGTLQDVEQLAPTETVPTWEEPEDGQIDFGTYDPELPNLDNVDTDKIGKEDWQLTIDTNEIFTAMGSSAVASPLTLSTDLSWYDDGVREVIHSVILAIVGVWSFMFTFEEFRRTA